MIVDQYTHKLGNTKGRVSIVYMDSYLVGKIVERSVYSHMVTKYALDRSRNQEILLSETQKLSFVVVIGGVENL